MNRSFQDYSRDLHSSLLSRRLTRDLRGTKNVLLPPFENKTKMHDDIDEYI